MKHPSTAIIGHFAALLELQSDSDRAPLRRLIAKDQLLETRSYGRLKPEHGTQW